MSLIRPAPQSLPWASSTEVQQGGSGFLLGNNDHAPAITVVAGIDLVNLGFNEGSEAVVHLNDPALGDLVLFQAFVYAQSQAYFAWRGEISVFAGQAIRVTSVGGVWDCHAWGAVIPLMNIEP